VYDLIKVEGISKAGRLNAFRFDFAHN